MSEIDTYQAGRALDALVAKEVFGHEVLGWSQPGFRVKGKWRNLPKYSTTEAAAFQVVKHLCQDDREPHDLYFKLTYAWWYKADRETKGYPLVRAVFDWKETGDSHPFYQGLADTIPLAICRAALRVVREDLSLPEVQR